MKTIAFGIEFQTYSNGQVIAHLKDGTPVMLENLPREGESKEEYFLNQKDMGMPYIMYFRNNQLLRALEQDRTYKEQILEDKKNSLIW